jgi:hypothetical protein
MPMNEISHRSYYRRKSDRHEYMSFMSKTVVCATCISFEWQVNCSSRIEENEEQIISASDGQAIYCRYQSAHPFSLSLSLLDRARETKR